MSRYMLIMRSTPEAEKAMESRTSTSTRSSSRWAATTRDSSRPVSCWQVRA